MSDNDKTFGVQGDEYIALMIDNVAIGLRGILELKDVEESVSDNVLAVIRLYAVHLEAVANLLRVANSMKHALTQISTTRESYVQSRDACPLCGQSDSERERHGQTRTADADLFERVASCMGHYRWCNRRHEKYVGERDACPCAYLQVAHEFHQWRELQSDMRCDTFRATAGERLEVGDAVYVDSNTRRVYKTASPIGLDRETKRAAAKHPTS